MRRLPFPLLNGDAKELVMKPFSLIRNLHCVSVLSCALVCLVSTAAPLASQSPASILVQQAVQAMGGEGTIRAVKTVKIEAMAHLFALEQSERPEGPYLVTYQQTSEVRDHERQRLLRKAEQRNWSLPNWSGPTLVADQGVVALSMNGRWGPHLPEQLGLVQQDLELAPERLLLTALSAVDLRTAPDRTIHGIRNQSVMFTHRDVRYTLYLSSQTSMPTMLQSLKDDSFGVWGDVTEERWYSFWTLQPGGWQYPKQLTTTWNGMPYSDQTVMTIKVNEPSDQASFAIPDETRTLFKKLSSGSSANTRVRAAKLDSAKAIRVNADVVVLPGAWNVTLVRQSDGVVVLDAPISSQYSVQVIDAAGALFPAAPIKAVVTTSDAWPHIGGIREYVARGIPIYSLDLNRAILERLVAARHSVSPDRLQQTPRRHDLQGVSRKTVIGEGHTRVELIPVHGEGSERMMLVHLPGPKLLYASDLLQLNRDRTTFFNPVYLSELTSALKREQIQDIDRAWAMHLEPIPWAQVTAALESVRQQVVSPRE